MGPIPISALIQIGTQIATTLPQIITAAGQVKAAVDAAIPHATGDDLAALQKVSNDLNATNLAAHNRIQNSN